MEKHVFLTHALIYLSAAVLTVPVAKRLGLGSVLGYVLAGALIGPWGLGFITDFEDIMHFAEFGVVLLLFLIGLELNPRRLWTLRKPVLVMGSIQVMATTAVLFGLGLLLGLADGPALIMAMGLSLSSTAMALQILTEKNVIGTHAGNSAFSVLLFQDIAVIPMIAAIPLLGTETAGAEPLSLGWGLLKALGVIVLIIVGGQYMLRPVFRVIAGTNLREIFSAFALFIVIGCALLMEAVGLSMALGSFMAGVLLAESEYRHELEINIEPFKGLLLGLLFISVGMAIDFGLLLDRPALILGIVCGLVIVKTILLAVMSYAFGITVRERFLFSFVLSQGGEFAFVLFTLAAGSQIMTDQVTDILILVVALSMVTTPLLMIANERLIQPTFRSFRDIGEQCVEDDHNPVIIAGFGRYGQIVGRLLYVNKIGTTVLDHDPNHIETLRKYGYKVYYGDVLRPDLLQAAGAERAKVLVVAIDDPQTANTLVKLVREKFPHLKVLVRAHDAIHLHQLIDLGVEVHSREIYASALELSQAALRQLGYGAYEARLCTNQFHRYDAELFRRVHPVHADEAKRISAMKEVREELEKVLDADKMALEPREDATWG